MSRISIEQVSEACLSGIETSFKEYLKWSRDEWLWNAPEYLLTVNIAKKIMKLDGPKYVTLEDNVRHTLANANAKIKGRLSENTRPDGRADIILWWGSKGTPRAVIEVKHRVGQFRHIQEDIDRIIEILKKESDLQFAISTFYMDRYYENKIDIVGIYEKKIKKIFNDTVEYLDKKLTSYEITWQRKIVAEDDKNVRAGVVFLIKNTQK